MLSVLNKCLFLSRLFNAHSSAEIRDKNGRPSFTVWADNPSQEILDLAEELGVKLVVEAEPERIEL